MCAGATLFGAIVRNCTPGMDIGIIGIGGLGHMGVILANKMGMRVTAFTGSKDHESIKKLGAYRVVNSRDLKAVKKEAGKYNTIITTIPHANIEFDRAYQQLLLPLGKFVQVGIPNRDS